MTRNGLVKLEATTTELVPFQGGHIEAHRQGERAFIAIKRVCENLDLEYSTQLQKLKRHQQAAKDQAASRQLHLSLVTEAGPA